MKLNNTLGLAIMALVKAYIVRPVIEIEEAHLKVAGLFIKDTFLGNSFGGGYERGKTIVTSAISKTHFGRNEGLRYSVEDALDHRNRIKRKLSNVDVWLPHTHWFTMVLKHAWDNRNDGVVINDQGIPCKVFPKPKFIQGWV